MVDRFYTSILGVLIEGAVAFSMGGGVGHRCVGMNREKVLC